MDNLAINYQEDNVIQEYGTVIQQKDNNFTVQTDAGTWHAKPALSCLLQPEIEDKVLILAHPRQPAYILAVLERNSNTPSQLLFENDVTFKTNNGKLNFAAQDGLNLVTASTVEIVSSKLKIHSQHANITINRVSFFGNLLESQIQNIKLIATTIDSICKRFTQKINRSYRTIEEAEHITADRFTCDAKTFLSLKGKYSTITAKEDVKIDGERIHIG